jgi:hypothetical protein
VIIKLNRGTTYPVKYVNFDEQEYYTEEAIFLGCCIDVWGKTLFVFQGYSWYYSCLLGNIDWKLLIEENLEISFKVDNRDNNFSGLRIPTTEWEKLLTVGQEEII